MCGSLHKRADLGQAPYVGWAAGMMCKYRALHSGECLLRTAVVAWCGYVRQSCLTVAVSGGLADLPSFGVGARSGFRHARNTLTAFLGYRCSGAKAVMRLTSTVSTHMVMGCLGMIVVRRKSTI